MLSTAEIVDEVRASDPALVLVAEALSLAAYIEPRLLRRARWRFAPRSRAELEGRFWFGPFIESAGVDRVLLDPDVAEVLRQTLRGRPDDAVAARELVRNVHQTAGSAITLFEDLVWSCVMPYALPPEQLASGLYQIAAAICSDPDRSRDLSRWVLQYVPRLPHMLRDTEAATALTLLAGDRLGVQVSVHGPVPTVAAELLGSQESSDTWLEPIGVQLIPNGIHLSRPPWEGTLVVELPISPSAVVRAAPAEGGLARHLQLPQDTEAEVAVSHLATLDLNGNVQRSFGLVGQITALAASSDLSLVAVGLDDGTVRWGLLDQPPDRWSSVQRKGPIRLAVRAYPEPADGMAIAITDRTGVTLIQGADGQITDFPTPWTPNAVSIGPGAQIALGGPEFLVFNLADASRLAVLPFDDPVMQISLDDAAGLWVCLCEHSIRLVDVLTHRLVARLESGSFAAIAAYSRNVVAASTDGTVRWWKGSDGALWEAFTAPGEAIAVELAGGLPNAVVAVRGQHELTLLRDDESRPIPTPFCPTHLVASRTNATLLAAGLTGAVSLSSLSGGAVATITPAAVADRAPELERNLPETQETSDALWFKQAMFYEVPVQAFADSNDDGTGDLHGLISKLDYLEWLGVGCLCLLPFYPSPLRDGGYDISDYRTVLPEYGTIEDFVVLVDEAHKRGIRVIIDLVMNHTSNQHPWFQESRRDRHGPYGDFYVWSDDDSRYPEARIIFADMEVSNWTVDPVRGQFYWHRFFSHEPDLNFENPAVGEAMLDVLRFWLDLGVDGLRLVGVPFLFEEEGTNCESLPRTHEFLKRCRRVVDDEYPGRVLVAEANQWPVDMLEYFGDHAAGGDECHMAIHFPLAPRIFMAVRRESRFPISEILHQTPPIPSGSQWGIFLRNHDELALEMATDEERDYMYSEYVSDPRMRVNFGIRRRLAPLLDNDRDQLMLFTALLLSLPGSPILYYGDEIGMGDNIWLGDRDAVRTPMQWTPDRNGGFSRCESGRLYLPIIMDPVYGYQAVNVEAQSISSQSLLNRTRRMIQIRREHPAFGRGNYHELGASNPSVLAYARAHGDEVLLCVNNFSRFGQPVELDLSLWWGHVPIELMGGVRFPSIGELPYQLTLPGHGFYWFQLDSYRGSS